MTSGDSPLCQPGEAAPEAAEPALVGEARERSSRIRQMSSGQNPIKAKHIAVLFYTHIYIYSLSIMGLVGFKTEGVLTMAQIFFFNELIASRL